MGGVRLSAGRERMRGQLDQFLSCGLEGGLNNAPGCCLQFGEIPHFCWKRGSWVGGGIKALSKEGSETIGQTQLTVWPFNPSFRIAPQATLQASIFPCKSQRWCRDMGGRGLTQGRGRASGTPRTPRRNPMPSEEGFPRHETVVGKNATDEDSSSNGNLPGQ